MNYRFVGDQAINGPGWATRNSGIMIHGQAPQTMGKNQDFPVSIEVQLLGAMVRTNVLRVIYVRQVRMWK